MRNVQTPFINFPLFENNLRFTRKISSLLLNDSTNKIRRETKVQREIKHGKTREEKKTHIEDESRNDTDFETSPLTLFFSTARPL